VNAAMEQFKIKHFEAANPGIAFPAYRTLDSREADKLRSELIRRLQLPEQTNGLTIMQTLLQIATETANANALDDDFSLTDVVTSFGIHRRESVFIDWYRFDAIDQIAFDDLVRYFDDIWYPSSDEISIFDASLSWVLLVSDFGQFSCARTLGPQDTEGPR
jgi:hypothetical protein